MGLCIHTLPQNRFLLFVVAMPQLKLVCKRPRIAKVRIQRNAPENEHRTEQQNEKIKIKTKT
jgi:hypothetical protein